jgi:hypothetical protein
MMMMLPMAARMAALAAASGGKVLMPVVTSGDRDPCPAAMPQWKEYMSLKMVSQLEIQQQMTYFCQHRHWIPCPSSWQLQGRRHGEVLLDLS